MPHKFTAARRHKFDKVQYRVINWAEYNESLRQRGDLTIWVSEEAQSVWSAPRRTSRGGQRRYSDLAIETCLMLRTAYHLGLRQTQGLMGSIGTLMGLDIRVPDYSTLSRRANGVSIAQVMRQAGSVPIHLLVDSTGLKIFGEGEWLAQKHNTKGIRRRWRKLHLGLDLASGAIVCDGSDRVVLDMDSTESPVHGQQEGSAYNGHFESLCYHPLLLFNQHGDCLGAKLRPGNVHSAEDWDELLLPEIERQQAEGKQVTFRADAAFAKPEIYEAMEERGVDYVIRIPANKSLELEIEAQWSKACISARKSGPVSERSDAREDLISRL